MRIGELAEAVGVTTRAVRHYHHQGLLPEPERLANGYRDYTLRHAVVLSRIRRLTELGLGLAEIRDVLAEDAGRVLAEGPGEELAEVAGKDLVEVLTELDQELARQEAAIRERRERLRVLLEAEHLPAEGPVSPELTALFARTAERVSESPMAALDREVLALMETAAPPAERERLLTALGSLLESPEAVARVDEAYALLDALADAEPDDPRVETAARRLAECTPRELLPDRAAIDHEHSFLRALYADFAPAQAEAVRRTLRILTEEP
ncbi:MerR family transcriptional regulator [Streptomyces sp. NPDC005820]|uniref:MerR family transcriptional regulator n=1 Tax=Streptomyces sp. NPDC005820 TaxID=3157069 RepID=UPI0033D5971E